MKKGIMIAADYPATLKSIEETIVEYTGKKPFSSHSNPKDILEGLNNPNIVAVVSSEDLRVFREYSMVEQKIREKQIPWFVIEQGDFTEVIEKWKKEGIVPYNSE